MTAPHADQIIDGYLARLEVELAALPATRRQELLDDVRGHIAEARGALTDETDADLLNIIDRLGDPAETATAETGSIPLSDPPTPPGPGRQNLLEIAAIVLLLVFWPVGVVLLWISDVWTTRDKLIGTLVPPGGYLAVFTLGPLFFFGSVMGPVCQSWSGTSSDPSGNPVTTSGTTCPPEPVMVLLGVLVVVVLIALVVSPIFTAIYLGRRLKRRTAAPIGQGGPARLVG